jgi:alkylation response protein AidB-like acyl-CoA dehydrogenase
MDFAFTSEQALLKSTARKLSQEKFRDAAFKWEGEYPEPNEKLLRQTGLLGISLPEKYGGGGLTLFEEALVLEEVARVCPDTGFVVASSGALRIVAELGSESLKEKYIPAYCRDGLRVGLAISEPEAGSAVTELRTKGTIDGKKLIINGGKIFSSHADVCDTFMTFVRFDDGIGAVMIDKSAPGFQLGKPDINMAGSRQYTLFFDSCEMSADQIIIHGPGSFKKIMRSFNAERCLSGMWGVASGLCAFDLAVAYVGQRRQFGQEIGEFQGVRWMLADMAMRLHSARLISYQAAADPTNTVNSSMAKTMGAEAAESVTSDALQLFGAYGYMRGHPLEYLYRMVRGRKIGGGTVQIQRNMMARELLRNGLN